MAFNTPLALLQFTATFLVSSGDYIAELTSYTESVIQQLALRQPGTFECVLFDMHKQHPFEVVLGDLMRSPKLEHVVKYAVGGSFAGETFDYPEEPSLVVIHAGRSYRIARDVPRKICRLIYGFSAKTKLLVLVDMTDSSYFSVIKDMLTAFRYSKVAFVGTNRKLIVRVTRDGQFWQGWEQFRNPTDLFRSNMWDLYGRPITFTSIDSRHAFDVQSELTVDLRWIKETAGYLNTTIQLIRNRCKSAVLLDKCFTQFLESYEIDIALDRLYPGSTGAIYMIFSSIPETQVVLVPRGRTLNVVELFLAPLTTGAWTVLLVIIVSLEVISVFFPSILKNDPALLLICGLERFNLHKANRWEKLILLSLIIFFFLVTNAYETKIISLMSSKPSFRTIQTIQELVTSGTLTKADFKKLKQMDLSPFKGTVVRSSDRLVSMDGVSAYLATRTKSRLYLPIFYFDYNLQRNTYVILDDHLGMLIGAYLTSNHNPLQEMLEWSERVFFEGGLFNLYTAQFQLESVHAMLKFRPRTDTKVMLTIEDLLPAWLSLAVGTVVSGLLFCGELLFGRCKKLGSAARRKIIVIFRKSLRSCYLVTRVLWSKLR